MRFLGLPRRKKATSTLPDVFSGGVLPYSPYPNQSQHNLLALPTKLEEVANSVHECVPQQLPGDQASQDDVRYFLYQILTLKDHNLARKSPQWVLETCMLWQGTGAKLRSLPLEAFQQLCPLHPGYAAIDWSVKGAKFRRQDIPPCGVRDEIGYRIKSVVEGLKRKEEGHRGPGWHNSLTSSSGATVPGETGRSQNSSHPSLHRFPAASFGNTSGMPIQNQFYSLGNHSLPLLHQMLPNGVHQGSRNMRQHIPLSTFHYGSRAAGSVHQTFTPMENFKSATDGRSYVQSSPLSVSCSPISSYCQTGSISPRPTESTTKSSPPSSESEHQFCLSGNPSDRPPMRSRTMTCSQNSLSDLYPNPLQRTPSTKPNRYKGKQLSQPSFLGDRSYHPAHHMAHLRSPSHSVGSLYAPSEVSLTPSDSATNKYGARRDSSVPPETAQSPLQYQTSQFPVAPSDLIRPGSQQTFRTALPYSSFVPSQMNIATPTMGNETTPSRPTNNYKVDLHALDTAELIGCKSIPGPMRSMIAEEQRFRRLSGGRSDSRLNTRSNHSPRNVLGEEDPVGPLLRFQNPRTGQPRLTIYETIEQQERLGKQHLENQRRVELQQGRLRTVFETIEEQELLDSRPQRGLDAGIGQKWSGYL